MDINGKHLKQNAISLAPWILLEVEGSHSTAAVCSDDVEEGWAVSTGMAPRPFHPAKPKRKIRQTTSVLQLIGNHIICCCLLDVLSNNKSSRERKIFRCLRWIRDPHTYGGHYDLVLVGWVITFISYSAFLT